MYFRAYRAKALAGEHAGDLKHEEERRKKRGLNKPCTFPLQGSLWFVFRALGNHGIDDSSGNQSSLESIDIPSKQRHCRLHFWQRKYNSHRQDEVSILIQVRETFHEINEFLHHRYFKLCMQTFNQKKVSHDLFLDACWKFEASYKHCVSTKFLQYKYCWDNWTQKNR